MSQGISPVSPDIVNAVVDARWQDYVLYPTDKPPVCFNASVIHMVLVSIHEFEDHKYTMYLTKKGKLILEFVKIELEFNGDVEAQPEDVVVRKVRALKSLNDVWTMFDKQCTAYIDFLNECGKALGDPNMFWLHHD